MWWTRDNSGEKSTKPRCPTCVTHPVLVQSGYGYEKSLKCPVCKGLFDGKGGKYDPDVKKEKDGQNPATEEEILKEQDELWDSIWGN